MRFMVIVKASEDSEKGVLPTEQELAEMGAYNEELVKAGVMLAGEGLHASSKGARVRFDKDGSSTVTDGPFAETKEQLGGIILLEATDLNHAIQIMSKHPSVRFGTTWEIRPSADLNELLMESANRQGAGV
jgi:hypothetical protein